MEKCARARLRRGSMSKTPRTDEHLRMKKENGHVVIVSIDFARQLETELAEARAELERLKKTAEIIPMKTMETIELNGVEYVRKDLLVLVLKMMEAKGLGEAFMTRLVMVLNNYKSKNKTL